MIIKIFAPIFDPWTFMYSIGVISKDNPFSPKLKNKLLTVETPGHEHFHDHENDDSRDVILHRDCIFILVITTDYRPIEENPRISLRC